MTRPKRPTRHKRRTQGRYELRPDTTEFGMQWDEIVTKEPVDFHMEALDSDCYWFGLTFANGDRLCFTIGIQGRRGRKLIAYVTEEP